MSRTISAESPPDTFVTISKNSFTLRLWKRAKYNTQFEVVKEFEVAVGTDEYPTPEGYFVMLRKARHPEWHPPDRDWVGPELRDKKGVPKVVAGDDPNNPIREAFLDLGDGIGVHGTLNLASLGTQASHGCIRVSPDDAIELWHKVPAGTVFRIY